MYLLFLSSFAFSCVLAIYFYIKLKEKEEDIEELYDLIYEEKENIRNRGKVVKYDKRIF